MFLNCLVCQYLFAAINDAAVEGGWWKDNASFQRNPNMDVPTTEDIRSALNVSSMTTTAAPSGLFVNFAGTDDCLMVYMAEVIAAELHAGIKMAAQQATWWEKDFALIASDGEKLP